MTNDSSQCGPHRLEVMIAGFSPSTTAQHVGMCASYSRYQREEVRGEVRGGGERVEREEVREERKEVGEERD